MFWWILIGVLTFAVLTSKSDARWLPVVIVGHIWARARQLSRRYCPSSTKTRHGQGHGHHGHQHQHHQTHHDDNGDNGTNSDAVSSLSSSVSSSSLNHVSSTSVTSIPSGSNASTSLTSVPGEPRGSRTPLGLPRVKATWQADRDAPHCGKCKRSFTFTFRRHHCRVCKKVSESHIYMGWKYRLTCAYDMHMVFFYRYSVIHVLINVIVVVVHVLIASNYYRYTRCHGVQSMFAYNCWCCVIYSMYLLHD
jgi:hypothetical protein